MRRDQNESLPVRRDEAQLADPADFYGYGYGYAAGAAIDDDDNWRRLVALLREKMWWIIGATALGGAVGFFASTLTEPFYETRASVSLEHRGGSGEGPIQARDIFDTGDGWVGLLQSNAVLEPVVRDYRLYFEALDDTPPEVFETLVSNNDTRSGTYRLKVRAGGSYSLETEDGTVIEQGEVGDTIGRAADFTWVPAPDQLPAGSEISFRVERPQNAAAWLRPRLTPQYDFDANIIFTTLTWPDGRMGAEIHNALIDNFIETGAHLKKAKLTEQVRILEDQTRIAQEQLQAAELAYEQYRVQTITEPSEPSVTVMPGGVAAQDPVFDTYFRQTLQRDQLSQELRELDQVMSGGPDDPINPVRIRMIQAVQNAPEVSAALDELQQAEIRRRAMLEAYTMAHPAVDSLTQSINRLRERRLPELLGNVRSDVRARLDALENQIDTRTAELQRIPVRTIEEARRRREYLRAEELHGDLLRRLNTARLQERTALPDMLVLDYAFPPAAPTNSSVPPLFILIGSVAGLGLGLGGVLLYDRFDTRIRHPRDIPDHFGLPLLGVVPKLDGLKQNEATRAATVESFRSIRTQLMHANGNLGPLLVTSSVPREGKSVVASNLAISYAWAGYRTILIDADLRRGRVHTLFGVSRQPGLADYLGGSATLDEIVHPHEDSKLFVMCSGSPPELGAELLAGRRMDDLLSTLKEQYDVIVLDGPPLAAGADSVLLGERCGKVVMVFRAGTTSQEMARNKLGMLGNVELPIVGAVLNAVPTSAPYYDHYVSYYYYADAEPVS